MRLHTSLRIAIGAVAVAAALSGPRSIADEAQQPQPAQQAPKAQQPQAPQLPQPAEQANPQVALPPPAGGLNLLNNVWKTSRLEGNALNFATYTYANTLGVEVAPVEAVVRAQLALDDKAGVAITSIAPESEAAKAGLKQHDVVLRIGEQPVAGAEKFHELVKSQQGNDVPFHVLRVGKPLSVTVKLPKLVEYQLAPTVELAFAALDQQYRIGVTLAEADNTLRSQLGLATGEGLVVTEVVPDSPAAQAGLRRHDVLTILDGKRLTTVEGINAQIQEIKDRQVTLSYLRRGKEATCRLVARLSDGAAQRSAAVSGFYTLGRTYFATGDGRFEVGLENVPQTPEGAAIRWLNAMGTSSQLAEPAKPAPAAEQLAALKKQLAEMQKTIAALEAALPAAAPTPPQPPK